MKGRPGDRKEWVEEMAEKAEKLEQELTEPLRTGIASAELRASLRSAAGHVRWTSKILRGWLARKS